MSSTSSLEENKALAERFHMEIFQQGKLSVADEILSRDFLAHFAGNPPEWEKGAEGTKKAATAYRTAFPDMRLTHHESIAEGDKVVIYWSASGTQKGELAGVPPSGKQMNVKGFDLFKIKNGKLVEMWQSFDQLGMMQQLGVLPPPISIA